EEASVSIGVLDYLGEAVRSALGIVVVDQAVEERARTDSEFAGMFRGWSDWLGYGANFGSINVKDLNELDLTKPVSDEMQLVAEVILFSPNYYPNIFRTDGYDEEARYVFSPVIKRQFEPVAEALKRAFEKQNYLHPTNGDELRDILGRAGIDFDSMYDPWGVPYTAQFSVDKKLNVVAVRSAGPDKTFGTSDDFDAFKHTFEYFTPIGKAIDTAVENYHKKTGEFIRDRETLLAELGEPEILDRYGRPYQFIFEGERRLLVTRIRSLGPDGKVNENSWRGDDFDVWTSRIDLFADLVQRINKVQSELPKTPLNETMFREELRKAGIDLDNVRDGNGEPVYINESRSSRFWDRITFETVQNHGEENRTFHRIITPVTQEIVKFTIRGPGRDRRVGTYDDVTVMEIVHVIAEQARDDLKPVAETLPAGHVNGAGMITGTVTDQSGAVVPGAVVTATNDATQLVRAVTSDAGGRFEFTALPTGTYTLTVEAVGFMRAVVLKIEVRPGITTRINIPMDVGSVSETVSVMAEGDSINTTSSYIAGSRSESTILTLPLSARNALQLAALNPGTTAGREPNSTPRLREYFPETLLWQPEVITDADGRAQVKFRMADNITTWKMYAIASSRDGKVGIAETKATAFQAFFADLDPPKFLTRGDEIFLPVQVRNYTDTEQGVNVEMAGADWFSFLAEPKKALTVRSGATENAVFGFRAEVPIVDGKQRVTAIADTDSDAIEKPVTVRPDGREMVNTESRYFTGTTAFDVDFPTNALPGTRSAELKIYPNLMSHVVESVEGLLERPYGCGEQTISSTYPNLMILKFAGSGSESRMPAATEAMARKYLRSGYERLVGYQVADGGFSYWGGRDTPDLALTAYALRFLADAAEFTSVDPSVVANAEKWLLSQQRADGSWVQKYNWESSVDGNRAKRTTTYIARTLAMLKKMRNTGASGLDSSLDRAVAFLKGGNAGIDDPYALALYGLTLADSGDIAGAHAVAERIAALAKTEGTGIYWNLESNTAFNGWGSAGRIETTALVAQLLMKLDRETVAGGLVSKAMLFLLKNKDRYGVWYSTQTTINVLDTFLAAMDGQGSNSPQNIEILINGAPAGSLEIGPDKLELITVPLSDRLAAGANRVELRSTGQSPLMASVTAIHYVGWNDVHAAGRTVNDSRALHLDYKCDKTSAPIMEEVTCTVAAERIGYRGYGMLLAEIGIPPGADVSRESLEAASENNWSFARYEVLPDRIIAYLWARPGGTNFSFKFRPRYGINAKTPASVVYDYYNPDAQAVNAPLSFKID
ncbi:MAG TPA: alpha-2-macroglobulin family protein, partial [Pyrinomonadaceae bacterium]|nr:alpha-2-macroglobulin family protein [Pyrinomonadaceae bacterium]